MTPGHEVQRLAVGVVLAVNAGDFEAAEMLVDAMDPAEQRAVILALGQLTDSGVRGRAGSPEAARAALETFACELATGQE